MLSLMYIFGGNVREILCRESFSKSQHSSGITLREMSHESFAFFVFVPIHFLFFPKFPRMTKRQQGCVVVVLLCTWKAWHVPTYYLLVRAVTKWNMLPSRASNGSIFGSVLRNSASESNGFDKKAYSAMQGCNIMMISCF